MVSHRIIVLVTGASGFIATHIVDQALRAGYAVRGTVRSQGTPDRVHETFSEYMNLLELVVIPDFTAPYALDEAVHDVICVIYTANPFVLQWTIILAGSDTSGHRGHRQCPLHSASK